jgi:malonyl-CoA decarboxylase
VLGLSADLEAEHDLETLRSSFDDVVAARGGEPAARRRAAEIAAAFLGFDVAGRERFFAVLADEYGVDRDVVDVAVEALDRADDSERNEAERRLRLALEPQRERLFRRFIGAESGLAFLVQLRADLLALNLADDNSRQLDIEMRRLLDQWFDIGLLTLTRITWESPASLLEKLVEYEAIHKITSWHDLRNRLGPDRRCFAFQHPALPDDLLIFVEVALTRGLADNIADLIDPSVVDSDVLAADTAIFYSISNCQAGLAGVRLGDFLIKRVVAELRTELVGIENFATLSPIPGFRVWLETTVADGVILDGAEGEFGEVDDPQRALELLETALADDCWFSRPELLVSIEPLLRKLCAYYLLKVRRGVRAADPVANFHLSNGAKIERLLFLANPARSGQERSLGMMVNYRYEPERIEENHDEYVRNGVIAASSHLEDLF